MLAPTPARSRDQGVLRDYLRAESHVAFDRRMQRYEALETPEDIARYQVGLRTRFIDELGGFPSRTELNPRIVGRLQGDGFHVENIIFESQPGFHVTANLYLPEEPPPHPVVLMPCGHLENGKAGYQEAAILLVRSGAAVLCYDPIGQGERRQISALETSMSGVKSAVGYFEPTVEHTILNVAPILLGRSLATYMIWDGIRAIDYLETRADLDTTRLGCAGNSGGGMMSSYLMALDPRISAAATACFITTSRLKNESPGPGDAEQNIHAQYLLGIDHPDFLIMHAPRPALIGAATRDFVPIAGTWDAFRQAKRIYTRLGYTERIDLVETDANHGFSVQLREGVARWMRRWLLGVDEVIFEQPARLFSGRELQCTAGGQVLELAGARTIFELYREEATRQKADRTRAWRELSDAQRRKQVQQVAGIRPWKDLPTFKTEQRGIVTRPHYRIEKLLIAPEEGVPLPALRFVPANPDGNAWLYVHGQGKHVDAMPGGLIEGIVRGGAEVLAVDLRGFGETAMYPWRYGPPDVTGNNGAEASIAYMLGQSLLGMRAGDILLAAKLLAEVDGAPMRRIGLMGFDDATLPALHAAAVESWLFSTVRLVHSIRSWESVIEVTIPRRQLESVVHGAFRIYDLPELAELAGNVQYIESVDATGQLIHH